MIIRIIATALIQCTVRTQAGWIALAVVGTARSSLAARLDMAVPWLFRLLEWSIRPIIRRELRLRYCHTDYKIDACRVWRSQKSEPGCPGSRSRIVVGTRSRTGRGLRRHQDGID